MTCMPIKQTPVICAHEMHAHETHVHGYTLARYISMTCMPLRRVSSEMHIGCMPHEVHAYEMPICKVRARQMHASKTHARMISKMGCDL
jgi:hypothetical protein